MVHRHGGCVLVWCGRLGVVRSEAYSWLVFQRLALQNLGEYLLSGVSTTSNVRPTRRLLPPPSAPAADQAAALWQLCCRIGCTATVACQMVGSHATRDARCHQHHLQRGPHGREAWCECRNGTRGGRWEPRLPGQPASSLDPHAPVCTALASSKADRRGLWARHADTHPDAETPRSRVHTMRSTASDAHLCSWCHVIGPSVLGPLSWCHFGINTCWRALGPCTHTDHCFLSTFQAAVPLPASASDSSTSTAARSPARIAPSTCPFCASVSVPAKCTPHGAGSRSSAWP